MKQFLITICGLMLLFGSASAAEDINTLQALLLNSKGDVKKDISLKLAQLYRAEASAAFLHGAYANSIDWAQKELVIYETYADSLGIADAVRQLGVTNDFLSYHDNALEYYDRASKIYMALGMLSEQGRVFSCIGGIYLAEGQMALGWEYYDKSTKKYKEAGDEHGLAKLYNNIGLNHVDLGNFLEAERLFLFALETFKMTDSILDLGFVYQNLGYLYTQSEKYEKAEFYCIKGLAIAESLRNAQLYFNVLEELMIVYERIGDFEKSLFYSQKLFDLNDSLFNIESRAKLHEMEQRFHAAQQKKDIELLELDRQKQQAETAKDKWIITAGGGVLIMLLVVMWLVLRSLKEKKRANQIILKQKQEVEFQKDMLDQHNREMVDSINYASRLQEAILPSIRSMEAEFKDCFVYYQPKDIVSGDFYWMHKIGDIVLFAVIDCTGHGVPGAMVSMVGYNGLNRCVKVLGLSEPKDILSQLDDFVENTFEREDLDVKDGMDMALCALNTKTGLLKYAGANNPLWVVSEREHVTDANGDNYQPVEPSLKSQLGLYAFKASKQPVGDASIKRPFEQHEIRLEPGDMLYIFSDGFSDQFGGPKGKKFKYKPFRELLMSLFDEKLVNQKVRLSDTINDWRGDLNQVDDICVMGVRI